MTHVEQDNGWGHQGEGGEVDRRVAGSVPAGYLAQKKVFQSSNRSLSLYSLPTADG
jgi:hypothetical protein